MKKLRGILVEPRKDAVVYEIDDTLEALQKCVHGYIEVIDLGAKIVAVINEEGKLNYGSEPNRTIYDDTIFDTFIVLGDTQDGDFCSLRDKDIPVILDYFNNISKPIDIDNLTDDELEKMRNVEFKFIPF